MGVQQVKIAFVGDGSVGKTSLVNSFTGKSSFMEQYLLTIGVNIVVHKIELDDDITINFAIWDMGGQKRFIAVRPTFYLGSQLVVYVFDLTNKNSFDNLIRWLEEVNRCCASHKGIIVGNKVDLFESRVVDFETAKEFAEARGFKYLETSAKDGTGTSELVEMLTDYVIVRPSQKSMEPAPLFRSYFSYMGRA